MSMKITDNTYLSLAAYMGIEVQGFKKFFDPPLYVTGQGKEEDIGDKALLTESLDIFKTQQRLAHENGLKVTIQMTYASLFNDEAVEIAKHDHEVYGDEIALSLLGLPC